MRRSIICWMMAISILLIAGCSVDTNTERFQEINEQEQPLYNAYPIKVFYDEQVYTIVILKNDNVIKGVQYSANRIPCNTVGLDLISHGEISSYLGITIDDVEADLGEYHIDIGSGGFLPSYLTEDGYLLVFSVNRSTKVVERVGTIDLFTGESVEWFPFTGDI